MWQQLQGYDEQGEPHGGPQASRGHPLAAPLSAAWAACLAVPPPSSSSRSPSADEAALDAAAAPCQQRRPTVALAGCRLVRCARVWVAAAALPGVGSVCQGFVNAEIIDY